ncbi:protein Aster-B-like [Macrobrachium nipponense]|uniref:protein Aster-B-like n=1 Tax=Macrobrachium nipponense TaxID=159736 RepID=UPI0030C8906C
MAESPTPRGEERLFFPSNFPDDSRNLPSSSSGVAAAPVRPKRRSREDKPVADELDAAKMAESKTPPTGNCPLESQHVGTELLNVVVDLPLDSVFTTLFVQEQFMTDVYLAKKTSDITCTQWQEREDGVKTRQMTYTMTLPPSSFSPKVSYVTENQVLLSQSSPGDVYIVESEVLNSGIPYADAFSVVKHFCICRQDDAKTSVVCWASVKFKKTLWGFVKTMIEKNTCIGIEGVMQELGSRLTAEAEKINNPGLVRKRRRAAGASSPRARSRSPSKARGSKKAHKQDDAESKNYPLTAAVMMIALVTLVTGNIVLYRRLFYLEEMAALINPTVHIPSPRYLSLERSWEDVARILHKQQRLHESQLEVWKTKVAKASSSLKDVQDTLQWMIEKIRLQEEISQSAVEETSEELKQKWLKDNSWKEEQLEIIAQKYSSDKMEEEQLTHQEHCSSGANTSEDCDEGLR